MAITRSQQAKQMLQYGGRIGFKRGNPMNLGFDPKEAAANVGKTSTVGGGGRDPMAQFKDLPPGYKTSQKNKEALRKQREGMRDSIRDIRRDDFIDTITDFIPVVGTLKKLGKDNLSDYYDTKVLPYLQRNPRMNQLTKDEYIRLRTMGAIDAMGRPVNMEDDDDQVFLPGQGIMTQAPGDMDQVSAEELSPIQQAILDRGTASAFLADGGMPKDAPVGGIMDLESGRQMYFLGKLVKKATRAIKKVAKSPIGKAALIGGLGYLAGGGGMPKFLGGRGVGGFEFGNIFSKNNPLLFSTKKGEQVFSPLKASALFALSPLFLEEDTNEEDYQKFLAERGKGAQLPASIPTIRDKYRDYMATAFLADGGRPEPVAKKTMPLLDMDGKEKDYRETGGFVDMGRMERADDVPARLSKNEFVFTADAVRNAGEGDIDKGAEVMYNMMKNLEAGGEVSEESQGLEGARKMFQTSQRLEEVL